MDVLMLSRLQFAAATFFHFLFVPLTLGLSVLIAIMETRFVKTGNVVEVVQGHANGAKVAAIQPAKLAAMESLWETTAGAPQYLLVIPDEPSQRNTLEFGGMPGALSMLAYHHPKATVKGLKDFPEDERPPVTITFLAFRTVVGLYPNLLPSSLNPAFSMTIHNSASSPLTLKIMLGIALTFVPVVIAYQAWVYHMFKGKVQPGEPAHEEAY